MLLNTASAIISSITKLEDETAEFYEKLSEKHPEGKETFLSFSKENRRYKTMVQRAYYGVITDALEACFSFKEGLNSETYPVKTELAEDASYADSLKVALTNEETIQQLYTDAATLSENLMADVPRTFRIVMKKRGDRIAALKT